MCTALAATVNTVTVADSAGAQRTVMAAVTEPEVLLDLAGMELESNDSTRLHEVEDGTLLLSLQRAFPVSVAADGILRGGDQRRHCGRRAGPRGRGAGAGRLHHSQSGQPGDRGHGPCARTPCNVY
ncbi:MAG: hypothetical protein V8T36_04305 [Ruthenibacterium lactatiformans]